MEFIRDSLVNDVASTGTSDAEKPADEVLAALMKQLRTIRDLGDHEICEQIVTNDFKQVFADEYMPAKPRQKVSSDDILTRQKLERILGRIDSVIHGQVANASNGRIAYADAEMGALFRLGNISRGVRAFALLQAAIRYRVLKDRDVLILDEPEIHLHPEWLMEYAELLVVMQEEMDLTILVTTHSAYFLQALQLYAKKYKRLGSLNAYKAVRADDGNVEIREELLGSNWDKAYLSFLVAANRLRQLRNEVNGDEN